MDAGRIVGGLKKAKQISPGQWVACCPAHNDKNPSLSITQTRDKVLVHCFAGCEQSDVLQALTDLGLWNRTARDRRSAPPEDHNREEFDIMADCCFVANSMKRRGEQPLEEDSRVLQSYIEVLKFRQPDLAILIAEDAGNV